jgi:hypothetical protein
MGPNTNGDAHRLGDGRMGNDPGFYQSVFGNPLQPKYDQQEWNQNEGRHYEGGLLKEG